VAPTRLGFVRIPGSPNLCHVRPAWVRSDSDAVQVRSNSSSAWVRSDVRGSGVGTFDPAWVRSDARELRVRLGRIVPTTPPTGARGVDDRLGNSARRHASARAAPSVFVPTGAGTGTMKGNARAWRLPGRVGRRRAGWGMGPQPLSVRRRGPNPAQTGQSNTGQGGFLACWWWRRGWLVRARGSGRPRASRYPNRL
jgi:hypothetical protein